MLRNIVKTSLRAKVGISAISMLRPIQMVAQPKRFYYPDNVIMKRHEGEYFADPQDVGERVVRLLALHDNVRDPTAITLNSTFDDLGLNGLDMVEVFLTAEREFDLEIGEDDCESMATVNDLVEFLSRNFYTK